MSKPFSPSSESNKAPILAVLEDVLANARRVLEIGSGTGQHAVHFAAAMPEVRWQTSDLADRHPGILAWMSDAKLSNVAPPLTLDVNDLPWRVGPVDAVYSANTAHIMDWTSVCAMFKGAGQVLSASQGQPGQFLLYGPFSYRGEHTSVGNSDFDRQLRAGGQGMGIRDCDDLSALAEVSGLVLKEDYPMPVNNRLLAFGLADELNRTGSVTS